MITKLTPEQEAQLTVYRDKWIKIGLSTEPTNKERALSNVAAYYEAGGLKAPKTVVFARSPHEAMIIANVLSDKDFWTELGESLKKTKPLADNVLDLTLRTTNSVNKVIVDAVLNAIGNEEGVDPNVIGTAVANSMKTAGKKWNGNYAGGNLWPAWISFYNYFDEVLNIKGTEKIRPTVALAQDVGWIFPYSTFCVLTEKPTEIHMNPRGQLHNEHGMSIKWSDGYGLYSLNGVTVPDWVITTPRDDVDTTKVLQLPTEQRFATMRLLGLSKFLSSLGAKELDKYNEYVLYSLTVEGVKIGPYLFMKCPSSGREFLEGVGDANEFEAFDTSIKTCAEALSWRMKRASQNLMTKFSLKWTHHS